MFVVTDQGADTGFVFEEGFKMFPRDVQVYMDVIDMEKSFDTMVSTNCYDL